MKIRTKKDFIRLIKREAKKAPAEPIRFDIHIEEEDTLYEVVRALNDDLQTDATTRLQADIAQWVETSLNGKPEHVQSPELSESSALQWEHQVYEITEVNGLSHKLRAVFYSPAYQAHAPMPEMFIPLRKRGSKAGGKDTQRGKLNQLAARLQKEKPDYHVETDYVSVVEAGGSFQYFCRKARRPVVVDGVNPKKSGPSYWGVLLWSRDAWIRELCHPLHLKEISGVLGVRRFSSDRRDELVQKEQNRSQGHKDSPGGRPHGLCGEKTLEQLVEQFVTDARINKRHCRGERVARKLMNQWVDETGKPVWRSGTIRKQLAKEYRRQVSQ